LRIWWVDAEKFGTSTALDFKKTSDFSKIIDVIAFFSGPANQIAEQWSVEKGNQLDIEDVEGLIHPYEVTDVKWLACTNAVFGSRTAAWSVGFKPLSELCPTPPEKGMRMVIKSTWVKPSRVKQELKVLTRLHQPSGQNDEDDSCVSDKRFDIPYPLGMVRNTFINDTEQARWVTTKSERQNSTMATFCVPAQLVPADVDARERFWLLEGFIQNERHMTERGVLYRDVNEGNIAQSKQDGSRAVIIDFGNARVDSMENRQDTADLDPAGLDAKIARSVNPIFSSRRIARQMAAEEQRLRTEEAIQMKRRALSNENAGPSQKRQNEAALAILQDELDEVIATLTSEYADCCNLDDIESAMFWYLYSVSHGNEASAPRCDADPSHEQSAASYSDSAQGRQDKRSGIKTNFGDVLEIANLDKKNAVWKTGYRYVNMTCSCHLTSTK